MQIPDICEVEQYQPIKKIFEKFCEKLKSPHFMVKGQRSLKPPVKVTLLWKLSEIGTLLLKLVLGWLV